LIAAAPPAEREAFLGALRRTAEAAGEASGGFDERRFRVAGRLIALHFAGPALVAPLTEALGSARTDGAGPPDLTVRIWDSESTGTTMPAPPWGPDDYREHGVIRGWFDADVQLTWQWITNALSVLEPAAGEGMHWTASAGFYPYFDRAAPLRKLLHLWFAHEGMPFTHAAALGDEDGCVLLAGGSGAGKSSATLACLGSQIGHIADDYCVLELGEDGIGVHATYSSAKANDDSLARLGLPLDLAENPVRERGDKAVILLDRHFPDALVPRGRLRAIAVPEITGERHTRVEPASPALAMAAIAPSTMLQLPGTGEATMAALAAAARSVPCFRLAAGTDPAEVPGAIEEMLGR
jgi:hypothetical protein